MARCTPATFGLKDPESEMSSALDYLGERDLINLGVSRRVIKQLPHDRYGFDGEPCWPADELDSLLADARRRRRRC